jgi:hypothetical protein
MSTESVPKSQSSVPKDVTSVPIAPPSIPKIPGMSPDMPLQQEYSVYLRELPRLLAEGHAGRYVLIKGDELVGLYDTTTAVLEAGYERFGLDPFCVQKVDPRDPERVAAIAARAGACPP